MAKTAATFSSPTGLARGKSRSRARPLVRPLARLARLTRALSCCAAVAAALISAGCSTTTPAIEGVKLDEASVARNLSALMEAPDQMTLVCTSTEPLSTQKSLLNLTFVCPEMHVEASLIEMRDAGWRLMAVDVGQEVHRADGLMGLPLTITMIKLF